MNNRDDFYNDILAGVNTMPSGNISPDLMGDVEDDFYAAFTGSQGDGFGDGFGADFGGSGFGDGGFRDSFGSDMPFQIPTDFDGFRTDGSVDTGAAMGRTDKDAYAYGTGKTADDMDPDWHVKVYGTRGSIPKPGAATVAYGGNTSCVSVKIRDQLIIFDAGSGIVELGKSLMQNGVCTVSSIHLFLSHLHLDHLGGLMNFAPLYDPKVELHIYSGEHRGRSAKDWLCTLFAPPFWPVTLAQVPALISFHTLSDGAYLEHPELGIRISAQLSNHPDECLMYRLDALAGGTGSGTDGKKSLVYGLDCELTEANASEVAAFIENAVLVICDAAYAPEDLAKHIGWGHSTWKNQTELLMQAGVHYGLMMHYSMDYDDDMLKTQEAAANAAFGNACIFAKEGMELVL